MSATAPSPPGGITVVYDGDCPFCAAYIRLTRLREAAGPVALVDARRSADPILDEIAAAGLDLDEGMVVAMDGRLLHGDAAMTALALLSSRSGLFNRAMRGVFASPRRSALLYPLLVRGRNATLRLLGRRKLSATTGPPGGAPGPG